MIQKLTQEHTERIQSQAHTLTPRQYAELLQNLMNALNHELHKTQQRIPQHRTWKQIKAEKHTPQTTTTTHEENTPKKEQ